MSRRTYVVALLALFLFIFSTAGVAYAYSYADLYQTYFGSQSSTPNPNPQPHPVPQPAPQPGQDANASITAQEQHLLDLINAERTKRGRTPVTLDMDVTKVARLKSQDMVDNHYYAHQSPTYGSLSDMLDAAGIQRKTAGDILVKTSSIERAVQLFMGSSVHRMHILKSDYTDAGVGIVPDNGSLMITVIFVKK